MKKIILAAALALSAFTPVAPLVQPAAAQGESPQFQMTPDMMVQLRGYMGRSTSPVATMTGVNVSTGTTIPESVELRSFPPAMNMASMRYVRTGTALLVVDPRTRRVVQVVQ